jgi:hypothetical protein
MFFDDDGNEENEECVDNADVEQEDGELAEWNAFEFKLQLEGEVGSEGCFRGSTAAEHRWIQNKRWIKGKSRILICESVLLVDELNE